MPDMLVVPDIITKPAGSVYHGVTSKTAQRTYIRTILASFLALLLLGLACLGYVLFYFNFIPQIGLTEEVHLVTQKYVPHGAANISHGVLIPNQPYDIYTELTLPTSPQNIEIGNFMVNLTLFDWTADGLNSILSSKRSTRLTYKSGLVNAMQTIIKSPLYLTGWRREEEVLTILMVEKVYFAKNRMPKYLGLRVGNDIGVQIRKSPEAYDVKVHFKARFGGLRYVMYNHRIISFLIFTSLFWMTELFWAFLAWVFISSFFSSSPAEEEKSPARLPHRIKEDPPRKIHPLAPADDDSEDIPRPRGIYATPEATPAPEENEADISGSDRNDLTDDGGGITPTSIDESYMHGSAADSGIGTSMSEGGSGLQRRRSNKRLE